MTTALKFAQPCGAPRARHPKTKTCVMSLRHALYSIILELGLIETGAQATWHHNSAVQWMQSVALAGNKSDCCYPLCYSTLMNSRLSAQFALGSWVSGFLVISIPAYLIARLSFCGSNIINRFSYSRDSLVIFSCIDTSVIERAAFLILIIVVLGTRPKTLVVYIYIISTALRIPLAQGQQKTFFTCSTPLTVVTIWYGSSISLYVQPSKQSSLEMNKFVSTLNTVVTVLLNPFSYTLRNKELEKALWKTFSRT
ncbi:olfactory receptor 287-like [Chrysemys picta bellii]|uniref:olfactory receptor 287-like n=1 Tax=Chrysemys picta bellii TaxID=8478 RepID=UPI0032B1C103